MKDSLKKEKEMSRASKWLYSIVIRGRGYLLCVPCDGCHPGVGVSGPFPLVVIVSSLLFLFIISPFSASFSSHHFLLLCIFSPLILLFLIVISPLLLLLVIISPFLGIVFPSQYFSVLHRFRRIPLESRN